MDAELQNTLKAYMPRKFVCVDIGARGGLGHPWDHLHTLVDAVYFEADPVEAASLQQATDGKVLPYALAGSCGEATLYLTAARRCSSLLEPDMAGLALYPELERLAVENTIALQTVTLDHLYEKKEIEHADFMKLDVQGVELDVMKGGRTVIDERTLGIELEVEFKRLYKGQALFRDVDAYLCEELGMELFDLQKYYWKYKEGIHTGQVRGQAIFGNALYFRIPDGVIERCLRQDKAQATATCCMGLVMGLAFGYVDYALRLLALAKEAEIFDKEVQAALLSAVESHGKTWRDGRGTKWNKKFALGKEKLYAWALQFAGAFAPSHGGWATWDPPLGSKKKWGVFM